MEIPTLIVLICVKPFSVNASNLPGTVWISLMLMYGEILRSHTSLSAFKNKLHRRTWCCIAMKFLTANDACGKLSTSRDPCRSDCSYQARVQTGNLRVSVTHLRV